MITQSIRRGIRHPASFSGRSGSFTTNISPIDALDPFLLERFQLETPLNYRQAYAYTKEVVETGMYLTFGGKQYPIKGVAPYPDDDGFIFYMLVLENLTSL